MLISILLGVCLAIVTIIVHATGTSFLIALLRRKREIALASRMGELNVLAFTAVALLVIHTVETVIWAVTYFWVVKGETFRTLEDAVYFSTVTFTALGYGDLVLTGQWRMLSAFQAMTGLLIFGWSTALLFAVVQRIWRDKFPEGEADL